jgi:malate dehydrogenase (oxaloacetate-decarboxylating)
VSNTRLVSNFLVLFLAHDAIVLVICIDCAKSISLAECNNSTCFPGIGLGAVLSRTRLLSDKMLVAAVKALAAQSPALKDPNKPLLPDVVDVREISVRIARAVIKCAVEEGLAQEEHIPEEDGKLEEWIRAQMWDAEYRPFVKPTKAKPT